MPANIGRDQLIAGPSMSVSMSPSEAIAKGLDGLCMGDLLTIISTKGFHAVLAGITLPNPASIALHEALGFEKIGIYREVGRKFGRWYDVGRWQCLLQERIEHDV